MKKPIQLTLETVNTLGLFEETMRDLITSVNTELTERMTKDPHPPVRVRVDILIEPGQ